MTEQVNVRELALNALLAITRDGQPSHRLIRGILDKYAWLPRRDRAFFQRLTEGTLERMIELDAILNHFSRVPVRKMKSVIHNILRLSLYQIRFMDSVPDRAAVNEAVKLARKRGFSNLTGFINGVLRAAIRGLPDWTIPDRIQDITGHLSLHYSMPEWITERFLRQFGEEQAEGILKAFLEEHPLTIRIHTGRISPGELKERMEEAGICVKKPVLERNASEAEKRLSDYAFFLSGYDTIRSIPGFEEGLFYIQDLSSMLVAETVSVPVGAQVLDVCAAPGGKSLHLFERAGGGCRIEMRDLTEEKTDLIRENIMRYEPDSYEAGLTVTQWDAAVEDVQWRERADLVIADLPCSGLGVIGHKPDIKYRASNDGIRELAKLQKQILAVIHRYVKPGGTLLYSTCTLTTEENEEQIRDFLAAYPEFVLGEERTVMPDASHDGFYIARMVRKVK